MAYSSIDDSRFGVEYVPPPDPPPVPFFEWLNDTYSPTWLQPLGEAFGATATDGLAGPNSSSLSNVTFGEPGLVDDDATAALFDASRIVYPKGAVLDRLHKGDGVTFICWLKADESLDNQLYTIISSNGATAANTGIAIWIDDRYAATDARYDKTFRVFITRPGVATLNADRLAYSNYQASVGTAHQGVVSPVGAVIPGQVQMLTITHAADQNLKMYVGKDLVADVPKFNDHATVTSTNDLAVGVLTPSAFSGPLKGLLQGLAIVPSVLSAGAIGDIFDRSGA